MITTITSFTVPDTLDERSAGEHFASIAPNFQSVPGLIRKQFLYSSEHNTAGGVYLWENRESADAFIEGKLRGMIKQQFGVDASVQYFSTPVIVDNLSQVIIA